MANPAPDPYMKRKLERRTETSKKQKFSIENESLSPEERIQATTTPLCKMPYTEQVRKSHNIFLNG